MTQVLPYSLRLGSRKSDHYYRTAGGFADLVLREAQARLGQVLKSAPITDATPEEQVVELLSLGVLWQAYGTEAIALPALVRRWLTALGDLRQRGGWRKRAADLGRALLGGLWLHRSADDDGRVPSLADLGRLIGWLEATGEYRMEARRLRPWREAFASLPPAEYDDQMLAILGLADWFEERSGEVLGRFTPGVEQYLRQIHPQRRWREDWVATGRPRVEYHLNMVGAELMNRAFRPAFEATERKVVLAPACMRARPDSECQATRTETHLICTGCTPTCRLHQIQQMGKREGFTLRIITHESSAFAGPELNRVGIVGIGCVSTLLAGGWKAKALGLPAQCVLLDACGCKKHWHESGIATDINIGRLRQVVRVL